MTKDTLPGTSGIVTVAATEEETQTAIDALLTLGSDMPTADAELDENAALVPLAPPHTWQRPPKGTWDQTGKKHHTSPQRTDKQV